jgi:hypothetical protein
VGSADDPPEPPELPDVTVIAFDVTDVRPEALKPSVLVPDPVRVRLVNVATPLLFVVAVVVPPKLPLPLATDAVTTVPA